MSGRPTAVFVVDDDPAVRRGLDRLLRSVGYYVETFGSAEEFLRQARWELADCLLLDVRMPGRTGLDLQDDLVAAGCAVSIVFVTGHLDDAVVSRAMRAGAVDVLAKPFEVSNLLQTIEEAASRSRSRRILDAPRTRGEARP